MTTQLAITDAPVAVRRAWLNPAIGRWFVALTDGRRLYRYRWVLEESLGRPLRADEHVHHKNGDCTDDRLENLQILTADEHARIHAPDSVGARRASWAHSWSAEHAACVICGTTERPHEAHGRCTRCDARVRARLKAGWTLEAAVGRPAMHRSGSEVVTRPCEHCGHDFSRRKRANGGRLRFCSGSCRSLWAAARRREQRATGVAA